MTDRILERLREQILEGGLAPGEVVIEGALAASFGTSKTPVREALRQLASEGLLTVLPKKGYLVRGLNLNDLREVLDLRMLLEPHAAGSAAEFVDDVVLEDLRAAVERQSAAGEGTVEATRSARRFHGAVARGSRNGHLAEALERCFVDMSRAHHLHAGLHASLSTAADVSGHEAVFSAIAAGDAMAAEEAMRTHLRSVRRTVMAQLHRAGRLWEE
ncbi:GntR family transcriptional regulator [Georgenia alba]|uniref:GntR family transcriptional regulator n=1 Tax=Georgenia alba TaxID=2233858 RepID=A0ABW2Q8X3_9MICO